MIWRAAAVPFVRERSLRAVHAVIKCVSSACLTSWHYYEWVGKVCGCVRVGVCVCVCVRVCVWGRECVYVCTVSDTDLTLATICSG